MPGRKLNLDNGDALGQGSVDLFLINLAAPILYAHGAAHGDMEKDEAELELWKKLPAEKNMYVRQWKQSGFDCNDTMNSQALLQLRKQYCNAGRCLECRLCHWLLRSKERNLQRIMQNVFLFLRLNIDKAMFFC
ncbi:hypothetical protein IMSAG025_01439 [Muribaculaceae bacterium]|nr:hypothetical protein IMSAGC016_01050 [Muribaculaceae bacterium]GFI57996.1 hypothetical protein IMSAG025_01439 [Muribaculaceae bacterium]